MFSPQYCLDEILPLMEAAYDITKIPPQWKLIGTIQPNNFGFVASYHDSDIDAPGGYGTDTVVVSICGTHSDDQWLEDFDAIAVETSYFRGRVHRGFMFEYCRVNGSIWKLIDSIRYDSLIILGHSLGGPMACYCAADIAKNAPQYAARVVGYTFESPKPGDSEFVADFNTKFPNWWRIQNIRDVIPTLPPPPIFNEHEGTTIWIDGGHTLDVHIAHGLETGVRPGLVKLVAGK